MFLSQEEQFDNMSFLTPEQKDTLKLTALLHDIGHVPLSHTTEQAMSRFYDSEHQDDSLVVTTQENESPYKEYDTKLHERLAQAVLMGDTSLRKAVLELGYSCEDISFGIMGFNGKSHLEYGQSKDTTYLLHARNFMHSQLDADRLDYLVRDSAFSGVKAGAFDLEKLLREIRYDEKANYGIDESGVRALEQFLFARFGAYSQIVFNKKVHSLEYLAQEFYYKLLIEKKEGNISDDAKKLVLSFAELEKALQIGGSKVFLSFVDSVFYELLEKALDGSLFSKPDKPSVPTLKKMACYLKNGQALKVVGYEEYFATEEENKFHNSFFEYLRHDDNLTELAKRAGVSKNDIILPPKSLSTKLIDKQKDFLCVFRDNQIKYNSLLDSDNSLLKIIQEKRLYLNRLFTYDEE